MSQTQIINAVENANVSTAFSLSSMSMETAIAVQVWFDKENNDDLQEFLLLAESAKVNVLQIMTTRRNVPQARYFVGSGKAEEIADAVHQLGVSVVLVNHQLTPAQTRNLENL